MEDQPLKDYFKFDESDLQANRFGQFTEKQLARLKQEDKSERRTGAGAGVFLMIVGAVGLIIAIVAGIAVPDWGFRIGFGLGFGVIWPLVWGGLGWLFLSSSFSKIEFKVAQVRGRVNIVRTESYSSQRHSTTVRHELHIGGMQFMANNTLADVMMQGDEYILYYLEGTQKIISAELISPAK